MKNFLAMLHEMDCADMAQYSVANHHVNGLDYLCLHRSEKLTIKLYLMEKPENPNSGFLVNPHSHRYSFWSACLVGTLQHVRFAEDLTKADWMRMRYAPETRSGICDAYIGLTSKVERIHEGDHYFVTSDEIHTLKMYPGSGPLLLGLVQFSDVKEKSELYLPTEGRPTPEYPHSWTPTLIHTQALRDRCIDLLEAA